MDVISRITADVNLHILPFTALYNPLEVPGSQDLDPLMGYASTLFPTLGRVVDTVAQVRGNSTRRNSPAIISRAMDLKRAIEDWSPPAHLECIDEPTTNMTDAIQTAEAYRWATVLSLYEAVPELSNRTSYGLLAQKVLVYLATIPIASRTIIVQIFPLMVAGCEAVEDEDREFVRLRWKTMSKSMISGIVGPCLAVTEEVWKRRDQFGSLDSTTDNNSTTLSGCIGQGAFCPSPKPSTPTMPSDFPWSVAFKRGVDTLTRSGCMEYTVKGRLHWLGVMKEWNWQVMLG